MGRISDAFKRAFIEDPTQIDGGLFYQPRSATSVRTEHFAIPPSIPQRIPSVKQPFVPAATKLPTGCADAALNGHTFRQMRYDAGLTTGSEDKQNAPSSRIGDVQETVTNPTLMTWSRGFIHDSTSGRTHLIRVPTRRASFDTDTSSATVSPCQVNLLRKRAMSASNSVSQSNSRRQRLREPANTHWIRAGPASGSIYRRRLRAAQEVASSVSAMP